MSSSRFASFDGTKIAYSVHGQEQERGRAVLLHHGFASTSHINWVRPGVLQALLAAHRRVVLLDARGHGDSDHPHEVAAYADGAMVKDVRALLDHLDLDSVDMAGYSMGAYVALGVAASGEERLVSLFLGGAGATEDSPERLRFTTAIARALESETPSSITDASARAFRNFADATGQDRLALAAVQRAPMIASSNPAMAIELPACVVNGDRDTLAGDPAELARTLPHGVSLVVPGDHLSAVTRPEFKKVLVEWMTGERELSCLTAS